MYINIISTRINVKINELMKGYNVNCEIIYGDSVTGDTPLLLQNNKNEIMIEIFSCFYLC